MTEEPEDDTAFTVEDEPQEFLPDTMSCPSGQVYFGGDCDKFLTHWLGKLGFPPEGGAVIYDEHGGLQVIHPETGELMSLAAIAKLASKPKLKTVQ